MLCNPTLCTSYLAVAWDWKEETQACHLGPWLHKNPKSPIGKTLLGADLGTSRLTSCLAVADTGHLVLQCSAGTHSVAKPSLPDDAIKVAAARGTSLQALVGYFDASRKLKVASEGFGKRPGGVHVNGFFGGWHGVGGEDHEREYRGLGRYF